MCIGLTHRNTFLKTRSKYTAAIFTATKTT